MNWQFCTLEQAIELRDLGVTQKSLFYWNKPKSEKHGPYINYGWTSDAIASAFNSSELLEMGSIGLEFFEPGDYLSAQLAYKIIRDINNSSIRVRTINSRLDRIFKDEFPVFSNNQNVIKSIN